MNTQTFAQAQDFTAITDDELIAVNGGWVGAAVKLGAKAFKFGRNAIAADAVIGMAGDAING